MKTANFLKTSLLLATAIAFAPAYAMSNDLTSKNDLAGFKEQTVNTIKNNADISILSADQDIRSVVTDSHKKPVFLFYHAKWCGYCNKLRPELVKAFDEHFKNGEATLLLIDYDDHPDIMKNKMPPRGVPHVDTMIKGKIQPIKMFGGNATLIKIENGDLHEYDHNASPPIEHYFKIMKDSHEKQKPKFLGPIQSIEF